MGDKVPLLESEETEEPGLRMVLVGKTGAGKSATGNTILGQEVFKSEMSSSTVTSECQKETGLLDGQTLSVVDTPGLFDTFKSEVELKKEIYRCISFLSPGPHVFLVVIQLGRFTEEEKETVNLIKQIFQERAADYTMALFTHGDDLKADGGSIEKFIYKNKALRSFIKQCGGGYHVFNNREKDASQVKELLEKINKMVEINGGSYYTNEMLEEAEGAIREETKQNLRENPGMKPKEARKRAERKNKFLWRYLTTGGAVGTAAGVGAGIGIEVGIGAGIGMVGGPVGAAVGAGVGLAVGGAIIAAKQKRCIIQ